MSDRKVEFKKVMKDLRDHYSVQIYASRATMEEYRAERRRLIREFRKDKMAEQYKEWMAQKRETKYLRMRKRKLQDAINNKNIPIKTLDKFRGDS